MNHDVDKPEPPIQMIQRYNHLKSNFYTVDYAELENGDWKVIECGDGQVSGILQEKDIEKFYKNLSSSLSL